ncbi:MULTISPECIES: hypothetical protein [unclassified Streptomyces]|uniref:hypothetical protein n=1 Tax=unclassified Streptomyces TaxID=2593676 RepID=UPI001F04802B|nr:MULTISPECIES: hypothetical protein [unclassified Streptomyces]MCH0563985.1 hypothetical protein [Streptomyces sp. MUM 2J]MCH0569688.1 hypothetical protein [Streptomyces sp. MUM 136J]
MPTEDFPADPAHASAAAGALLLCRARPDFVAPVARLLREHLVLAPAGGDWTVLVPEGRPWRHGGEPVDRVVTGWAAALAVGAPWPALALWWDADRAGFALASGFRRPVGYIWLADGTPAGEDEALRTFAVRLGLDPVLDVQSLERLTVPAPGTDARARLRGLLAILTRAGVGLPPGLDPGESADRLRDVARARPGARRVEPRGLRETARAAPGTAHEGPLGPRPSRPRAAGVRASALAQVAVGLPLILWGLRRRDGGWVTAGALLLGHGALSLAYDADRLADRQVQVSRDRT